MNEMIERVARAIWAREWDEELPASGTAQRAMAEQVARCAIEAMREPTEEMCISTIYAAPRKAKIDWQAMIDSAMSDTLGKGEVL